MQYDGDLKLPANYLVPPPLIERTSAKCWLNGLKAFACSETQKFGHVTFFWSGNRSGYFNESLETYVEIPSDNVPFNQAPLMKAREITAAGKYDEGSEHGWSARCVQVPTWCASTTPTRTWVQRSHGRGRDNSPPLLLRA